MRLWIPPLLITALGLGACGALDCPDWTRSENGLCLMPDAGDADAGATDADTNTETDAD